MDAPVLTWVVDTADTTPGFTVDYSELPAVGDVVRLHIDASAAFPAPLEITDTLDAGEVESGEQSTGMEALQANGTYYARLRVERLGVDISGWSNTETITLGDGIGPSAQTGGDFLDFADPPQAPRPAPEFDFEQFEAELQEAARPERTAKAEKAEQTIREMESRVGEKRAKAMLRELARLEAEADENDVELLLTSLH